MKLNIGCGNTLKEGYVNIDLIDLIYPPDNYIKMNAFDIDRKFVPCFDEVYSEYFMEHLSPDEIRFLLYKIHKVMLPKGKLVLIVPNIKMIVTHFTSPEITEKSNRLTLFNLEVFGSEATRETVHKSLWTTEIAEIYIEEEGLFRIEGITCDHIDLRNVSMLITAERI